MDNASSNVAASRPAVSTEAPERIGSVWYRGWGLVAVLVAYCVAVALIFLDTTISIVGTWMRSETFAHGFLIIPISAWLVWRRRQVFDGACAEPAPLVLLLSGLAAMVWLLAGMVDVQGLQQLSLAVILISGMWAIMGTPMASQVAFPLGFLILAVPMGGGLIQPLTNLTADTTEYLVRASGIPVFREGNFLTLPTGRWSVVEACSGIRYLIASVTLGLVYAYLSYRSIWRRVMFVIIAAILPIVANSLRAYFIVMIGHLSNMELAVGVDHLLYGWVFFGLVMLLLFWLGSFWAQPESKPAAVPAPSSRRSGLGAVLPVTVLLALGIAAVGPVLSHAMLRGEAAGTFSPLAHPPVAAGWERLPSSPVGDWQPRQPGADREVDAFYSGDGKTVGVFLRQYLHQTQGVELVNTTPPWRPEGSTWYVLSRGRFVADLGESGAQVHVDEAVLSSPGERVMVWTWYRIDDHHTANPYLGKLLEARQQLFQGSREGARIFLATPLEESVPGDVVVQARLDLQSFLNDHFDGIERVLEDTGFETR